MEYTYEQSRREDMIIFIENRTGTLRSVPWAQVSSEDLEKLVNVVGPYRKE